MIGTVKTCQFLDSMLMCVNAWIHKNAWKYGVNCGPTVPSALGGTLQVHQTSIAIVLLYPPCPVASAVNVLCAKAVAAYSGGCSCAHDQACGNHILTQC